MSNRIFNWDKGVTVFFQKNGAQCSAEIQVAERLTPAKKMALLAKFAPDADELVVCKSGHSNHRYGGSFSSHTKVWNYRLAGVFLSYLKRRNTPALDAQSPRKGLT